MARAPAQTARPPIVALKEVRLRDGPVMLFDGVDLALEPRVRATLVGRNGAGKSTLMRLIAGRIEPDGGERFVQPGLAFVHVEQEPAMVGDTVLEHATAGGAPDWRAEAELTAFGLDPAKSTVGLSGGETRRAALARAFAEEPDLLLLDEPTNHLDIAAIETLEARLAASKSAALIVSHDRAFLARITGRCFWLEHRRVRTLDAGFGEFDAWAERVEAEEQEAMRRLEKTIAREQATFYSSITARRTRNEGRAARLSALRDQHAAAMKDVRRTADLQVETGSTSGRLVAELKGVSKAWGDKTVVERLSTRVMRGDRLAIVGPNGAGKTTLVKLLLGEVAADAGEVRLGAGLEAAYLDQARAELKPEDTMRDVLAPKGGDAIVVRGRSMHVAGYAKDFGFRESQLRQPVASLSGGERNRLLLARALARPANLLVLDEPTNDLDMETLDRLEEMLSDYDGTLILVSHDRDFIDRLATSTLALDGRGNAVETPGGWSDFIRQNPGFLQGPPLRTGAGGAGRRPVTEGAAPRPAAKLSYKDARRLEELESLVARLPAEIDAAEHALDDPGLYARDPSGFDKLMRDLDARRARLAAAEAEWLELAERREALAG